MWTSYKTCSCAPCRSEDKGQKLREAWEAQQFLRAVEDVEVWIAEMETQLSSEDTGRDLISVNSLLKRHEVGVVNGCNGDLGMSS